MRGIPLHDLRQSKLVKSLVACGMFFSHWNLNSVLLDDTVEWLVVQSVVAWRKWKVCTASSQFVFELGQISPQNEQSFFELVQDSGLGL